MQITLTAGDFNRLSASCQAELLSLLRLNGAESQVGDELGTLGDKDWVRHLGDGAVPLQPVSDSAVIPSTPGPVTSDKSGGKRIIEMSIEQARQLVGNISALSKRTLRLFALGKSVSIASLIGPNTDYSTNRQFKVSLVGAVNRRLRTVTGNRAAVLFSGDSSMTSIRIRPLSAAALRVVLDVQEPLPYIELFHKDGRQLEEESSATRAFLNCVGMAWRDIKARPAPGRAELTVTQITDHLLVHGFRLVYGRLATGQTGGSAGRYEYMPGGDAEVIQRAELDGRIQSPGQVREPGSRTFFSHGSVGGVLGSLCPET